MKIIPQISVCIPSYNRAELLPPLLDSIFAQTFEAFDIVIIEDNSPQRLQIRKVVEGYERKYPGRLKYTENEVNLGYDGNLRKLIESATGEYVFFMGNDDLMCAKALENVSVAVKKHSNVGLVLRSYAAFTGEPSNVVQTFRYFEKELYFPPGEKTIATMYRRSVVIPGMVMHRKSALQYSTSKHDGTLLYQLYLVAEILKDKAAVFLPSIAILYRNGGVPDFGNSEVEKGRFVPEAQTPESSIVFVQGMLKIARSVAIERSINIYSPVLRDIANYSYPLLSIQARQPRSSFLRYGWRLSRLGFWRFPIYWIYFLSLALLGVNITDRIIANIKNRLGYTPSIGNVYSGQEK